MAYQILAYKMQEVDRRKDQRILSKMAASAKNTGPERLLDGGNIRPLL